MDEWSNNERMFYFCKKCNRVFRESNLTKHMKKCIGATFLCCNCGEEYRIQDIPSHLDCSCVVKSVAPPLYNPKARIKNPSVDAMLIMDRMAFDNKDETKKLLFATLKDVDNIPAKENGFITFICNKCKCTNETAKQIWGLFQSYEKRQIGEKRNYRHNRKETTKKMKAESKRVERMEQKKSYYEKKEKKEKKEESVIDISKWEKKVTKLMRQNIDNYKVKDDLRKAVLSLIKEKEDNADDASINAVFEAKYPSLKRD